MYEPYNYNNIYNPYGNPYLNYNQQPQLQTSMLRQNQYVSYFPLTDGTAIITKQLQQDGTSKVVIYKPMIENEENKYITETDLEKQLKDMDNKFITEDDLRDQLKNVNSKDIKDLKEDMKILKRKLEDITDDLKYKKEK